MHIPYKPEAPDCAHEWETSTKGQWQNWEIVDDKVTGRFNYVCICLECGHLRWSDWVTEPQAPDARADRTQELWRAQ